MPAFTKVLAVASLAALAQAIRITSPTKGSTVDLSQGLRVTWTSVSTDPSEVDIYVVDMTSNPPLEDLVQDSIDVKDGAYFIEGVEYPPGGAYQINLVSSDPDNTGILAQSNQFSIENSGSGSTGAISSASSVTQSSSSSSSAVRPSSSSSAVVPSSTSTLTGSVESATSSTKSEATSAPSGTATDATSKATTEATSATSSTSSTPAVVSQNGAVATGVHLAGLVFGALAALV